MDSESLISTVTGVVGFLVVGGITFFIIRRFGAGAREARAQLPGLAKKLHLDWRPADQKLKIGIAHGTYRGRELIIAPDERDKLVVRLARPLDLWLCHRDKDPPESTWVELTLDRPLNGYFRGRYAAAALESRINEHPEFLDPLRAFVQAHGKELIILTVGPKDIRCSPHKGSLAERNWSGNVTDYITGKQVMHLLPDLYKLAKALDKLGDTVSAGR